MDDKKPVQKELFEEFTTASKRLYPKGMFRPKEKKLFSFTLEFLIVILIVFIVLCVISFALGVEKGRRIAIQKAALPVKEPKEQIPAQLSTEYSRQLEVPSPQILSSERKPDEAKAALIKKEPTTQKKELPVSLPQVSIYTIQVASYSKEEEAKREVERLKQNGLKAFMLQKGKYSIVCVGDFKNKTEASVLQKTLRKNYPDCLIRER
jgi:cell division septation protein DedD